MKICKTSINLLAVKRNGETFTAVALIARPVNTPHVTWVKRGRKKYMVTERLGSGQGSVRIDQVSIEITKAHAKTLLDNNGRKIWQRDINNQNDWAVYFNRESAFLDLRQLKD